MHLLHQLSHHRFEQGLLALIVVVNGAALSLAARAKSSVPTPA